MCQLIMRNRAEDVRDLLIWSRQDGVVLRDVCMYWRCVLRNTVDIKMILCKRISGNFSNTCTESSREQKGLSLRCGGKAIPDHFNVIPESKLKQGVSFVEY